MQNFSYGLVLLNVSGDACRRAELDEMIVVALKSAGARA
jgi:hypothetical protein